MTCGVTAWHDCLSMYISIVHFALHDYSMLLFILFACIMIYLWFVISIVYISYKYLSVNKLVSWNTLLLILLHLLVWHPSAPCYYKCNEERKYVPLKLKRVKVKGGWVIQYLLRVQNINSSVHSRYHTSVGVELK